MLFIPPMLATRLEDPRRLADPCYIAEPKLDGQRAQLHVRDYRTIQAYSRPGRELIRLPGLAWLREIRWPVASAVLDGEVVAGDGSESIQGLPGAPPAGERHGLHRIRPAGDRRPQRPGGTLDGPAEAAGGSARRAAARDLSRARDRGRAGPLGRLGGPGRRGHRPQGATSAYRPGVRSPAWLKLKPKLPIDVLVMGGSEKRIVWGDWGEAVMLAFRYTHPRTGAHVEIRQAVRVPRDQPFDLKIGANLALVRWGIMPSGLLRHPVLRAER
jgi:hypothetical protein